MAVRPAVAAIFHGHALATPTGKLPNGANTGLGGHCGRGGGTQSGDHPKTSPT